MFNVPAVSNGIVGPGLQAAFILRRGDIMEWNIVNVVTLISAVTAAIVTIINAWKTKTAFQENRAALDANTSLTEDGNRAASLAASRASQAVHVAQQSAADVSQ